MNRKIIVGVGVTALLLVSTACGGSAKKDDQAVASAEKTAEPAGDTSSTSTSNPAGSSTTTAGSGDTSTTAGSAGNAASGVTEAAFEAKANALCSKFNDQVSAVPQPTETTPAALGAYLDQAMTLLDQQIGELKTLSPPASMSAAWARVMATIDAEQAQIHALVPRLMAGDATAIDEMQAISSDDINAQFDALGMVTCGSGSG